MLIFACDVYGTFCIDWVRSSILGGKPISSMDGYREGYLRVGYLKRERESLQASGDELLAWWWCLSYEMEESEWGASHQVVLNDFTSRKVEKMFFQNLFFFSLFEHKVEILRIMDINYVYTLLLPQCHLRHNYSMTRFISSKAHWVWIIALK